MNKLIRFILLFVIALVPITALAEGQVSPGLSPGGLSMSGRAINFPIHAIRTLATTAAGGCTVSATVSAVEADGRDGVVTQAVVVVASGAFTVSTFGTQPYASRLEIDALDNDANGTALCTNVYIKGYGWNGKYQEENMAISEAIAYTAKAYNKLISVAATGCSGFDTGDEIRIRVSRHIAFPWPIRELKDVDAVCAAPPNETQHFKCLPVPAAALNYTANTVDILSIPGLGYLGALCAHDRSTVMLRGRASPFAP